MQSEEGAIHRDLPLSDTCPNCGYELDQRSARGIFGNLLDEISNETHGETDEGKTIDLWGHLKDLAENEILSLSPEKIDMTEEQATYLVAPLALSIRQVVESSCFCNDCAWMIRYQIAALRFWRILLKDDQ